MRDEGGRRRARAASRDSGCEPRSIDDEAGSFGRCRLSEPVATALGSASVCVGVVERFEREQAGDRDAEEAVVSLVDGVNADVVRTRVPEESDHEAVLLTVGEFFEAAVRHGEFLSVMGHPVHSPIMRPWAIDRARGNPTPDPDLSLGDTPGAGTPAAF